MQLAQFFRRNRTNSVALSNNDAFVKVAAGSHQPSQQNLIDLRGVVKSFNTPAGEFRALRGIDLQISTGEFIAVIGKSGSGKSTLSNMITGIDRPTSGEVVVAGTRVDHLSEGQIASWRGRTIGVVQFQ